MTFTTIAVGSLLYEAELALRDEVLRRPLGMRIADDKLSDEINQWHFGVSSGGELVACVILVPRSIAEGQLRQMAVSNEHQGSGVGRALVEQVEQQAWSRGIKHIMLHARATAIGFYERLGYACEGDEYLEVGLPHRTMTKTLDAPPTSRSRA